MIRTVSSDHLINVEGSFLQHASDGKSVKVHACPQWRSHWGGKGGRVPPLTAKKLPKIGKIRKKSGKNQEKSGKNQEKLGEKRKNWEEKAKIRKFLSLCPS